MHTLRMLVCEPNCAGELNTYAADCVCSYPKGSIYGFYFINLFVTITYLKGYTCLIVLQFVFLLF